MRLNDCRWETVEYLNPLFQMELSLHLPHPFKTWAEFHFMITEQLNPDSTEDIVTITEVRPTGISEGGYTTHYSSVRKYSIPYIEQQVAHEEQKVKQQQTFTFSELQTILYALGRTSRDLDPDDALRLKVQNMRDNLVD